MSRDRPKHPAKSAADLMRELQEDPEYVMVLRATRVIVCLVLLPLSVPLAAQEATRPPTTDKLGVPADGSRNPELVPERVAVAGFFSSMVASKNRDTTSSGMGEARIKSMGLSRADERLFRTELTALSGRLRSKAGELEEAYARARTQSTPEASADFTSAVESRDSLTWESYQRLLQALTPKGANRLAGAVAQARTQMKSVGPVR